MDEFKKPKMCALLLLNPFSVLGPRLGALGTFRAWETICELCAPSSLIAWLPESQEEERAYFLLPPKAVLLSSQTTVTIDLCVVNGMLIPRPCAGLSRIPLHVTASLLMDSHPWATGLGVVPGHCLRLRTQWLEQAGERDFAPSQAAVSFVLCKVNRHRPCSTRGSRRKEVCRWALGIFLAAVFSLPTLPVRVCYAVYCNVEKNSY